MITATTTERRRRRWTCSGCAVEVRNESGEPINRPAGWDADDRCVACQRKAADKEDGSEGVLRFELLRGTPLKKAAKQAHVTMAVARSLRAAMVRRGEIEPLRKDLNGNGGAPRRKVGVFSPHKEEIERALRENPTREDGEIAKEVGVTLRTVMRARQRLGLPPPPTQVERDAKALREIGGPTTTARFGALVGVQRAHAGRRLRALVAEGLATVEVVSEGRTNSKLYRATEGAALIGDHPAEGGKPLAHLSKI